MNHFKGEFSERNLSEDLQISRGSLRKFFIWDETLKLSIYRRVLGFFGFHLDFCFYPKNHQPIDSILAISIKIREQGVESWKIHLMNFVDEFRETNDMRLIVLPPDENSAPKIKALLAGTVGYLCSEKGLEPPLWVKQVLPLSEPWFVSGMESLKAYAILESPFSFRSKNIFVQQNFLERI